MKHLFFDLDRTLWDFEKNSELALKALYEKYNLDDQFRSFADFHSTYKKINAKLWHAYGKGQISKPDLRLNRFKDTLQTHKVDNLELASALDHGYIETAPFQTNLFPYAKETLTDLKNSGFELHIITNGFREVQFIKLENTGLIDYFDVVLCSEEVGQNKPAKAVFNEALLKAGAKASESIMIGDDYLVDVVGAERVGIRGVLFDPQQGYRKGTHEWHIQGLNEIPAMIPWIAKSNL